MLTESGWQPRNTVVTMSVRQSLCSPDMAHWTAVRWVNYQPIVVGEGTDPIECFGFVRVRAQYPGSQPNWESAKQRHLEGVDRWQDSIR